MNENIRKMVDAAIVNRPVDFREAFKEELGARIMNRMAQELPEVEMEEEPEEVTEEIEDEDLDIDEEDLQEAMDELLEDETEAVEESAQFKEPPKVADKTVDYTKANSVLQQIRDKAQKRFTSKHIVNKVADRNGNGDDVFSATNVGSVDRQPDHGYNPGDDTEVYEETQLEERKLTKAEMEKREEVAQAIERDNPDMPMSKKMAIATATAKKSA